MSKAIQDLINEHKAIQAALQTLSRMSASAADNLRADTQDMGDFIGFLREFADKCHHGKEEGFLFPALVQAGVPEQGDPIGVLLAEHAQGRQLIARMADGLTNGNVMQLVAAAQQYILLLRAHIQKENQVLFPLAERVLSSAQLDTLYQSFEEHEEKVIGVGRHEQLHALLEALAAKYVV
jgi:hemerythrin-like domain-containing protein